MNRVVGTAALVTEAARGIGHAVVERLARDGATKDIVDCDRDSREVTQAHLEHTDIRVLSRAVDLEVTGLRRGLVE